MAHRTPIYICPRLHSHIKVQSSCGSIMEYDGLIQITPSSLSCDAPVGVNIYVRQSVDQSPILFVGSDQTVSSESLQRLCETEDIRLYINTDDARIYRDYLKDRVSEWSDDDTVPAKSKAAATAELVRSVLSDEFARNETDNIVGAAQHLAGHISQIVSDRSLTGPELCNILHHDYGTFTHSANVGFYCSLLASRLGFTGDKLAEITSGGLLHDIGKLDIDLRILNKPGKLDEFEFRTIKEHPLLGTRRLTKVKGVTKAQLLMTYQHHERLDGKGYPVGIDGEDIDISSRICSVADVFEAMTSNRPYRRALSHAKVLEIMSAEVDTSFDQEVFACWTSIVKTRSSN
ncbi:MAG: HD domain-containing phosphohydrolase [Pirellula sp.]